MNCLDMNSGLLWSCCVNPCEPQVFGCKAAGVHCIAQPLGDNDLDLPHPRMVEAAEAAHPMAHGCLFYREFLQERDG